MCRVIYKVELTSEKIVGDDLVLKIKNESFFCHLYNIKYILNDHPIHCCILT